MRRGGWGKTLIAGSVLDGVKSQIGEKQELIFDDFPLTGRVAICKLFLILSGSVLSSLKKDAPQQGYSIYLCSTEGQKEQYCE